MPLAASGASVLIVGVRISIYRGYVIGEASGAELS